jgi:predicted secreted protein
MQRRSLLATALGLCLILTLACTAAVPAHADSENATLNRVSFEVERSRGVENDRITAVVGVTDEDSEAPRLADRVNRTMKWALEKSRAVSAVETHSGSYQTHPVHEDGKIRRWRASQDLVLTSGDVEALTSLVGELQSRLLVRSVTFSVSPERRHKVQDELISECLEAYQRRAALIQAGLSARGYALVDLGIDTPSHGPAPRMARLQSFDAEIAAPAFEAGESELTVRVRATIELEK